MGSKNCLACKHLEYMDCGSVEDTSNDGYACNKRQYRTQAEEDRHLAQLEYDSYLGKARSCCETPPEA